MSILSYTADTTGQVNVNPRIVKLVTNDYDFTAISSPGYIPQDLLQIFPIFPTDLVIVVFGNNTQAQFIPIINNGVVTLQPYSVQTIPFFVIVTAAALAGNATVTLVNSYNNQVILPQMIVLNAGIENNINFSGTGGNRNLAITTTGGFNVYSIIPAATLQDIENVGRNSFWGGNAATGDTQIFLCQLEIQ